jgi:hypothetical protein
MKHEPLDIDDVFEDFMRKVNPSVAEHSVQYKESRRCFFAGCAAVFYNTIALTTIPEPDAMQELTSIDNQLTEFQERLKKTTA